MKLAEFSVRNSLFVNLLSLFIFVVGMFILAHMHREAFPNVAFDVVSIQTVYFGAPAAEVEKLVTIPIEKELVKVDDVKEIISSSVENISAIRVKIEPDAVNKDKVVTEIQRAVDNAKDLPDDAEDPEVEEIRTKDTPIVQVSLSGTFPQHELQRYAKALEDKILDVDGVASVQKSGWHEPEIWVELNPATLAEYHLSINDVMQTLKKRNVNLSAGSLVHPAYNKDYLIRTLGEFYTTEEIEEVIVRANPQGHWIKIKDIGTVRNAFEDSDIIHRTNGKPAINLIVIKKESGDIISIVEEVKRLAVRFKQSAPDGLDINFVDDMSFYVDRRLNVLKNNGLIGIFLVMCSLLLLLDIRVAMMTALGIPLSLLITLIIMQYLGFTINLLTMFGLIMVLGMIVDDAIVISENTFRHIENGIPPKEAAVIGTAEVWKPVTTTIVTTTAAFSSLFFMTGIMGKFVKSIPIVVIIALAASLFESFVILPSHLADFVKPRNNIKTNSHPTAQRLVFFIKIREWYVKLLTRVLRHRIKFLFIVVLTAVTAFLVYKYTMKYIQFPAEGIEQFFIRTEMLPGTPLEETSAHMVPLEKCIGALPAHELDYFVTLIGITQNDPHEPAINRGKHFGQIRVFLTPEASRQRSAAQIIDALREQTAALEGFTAIEYSRVQPGPPVGAPVVIKIKGDVFQNLEVIAEEIKEFLGSLDGITDIRDDFKVGTNELRIRVDETMAMRAQLSISEIASSLRNAFEGGIATTIKTSDEEIDVRVRLTEETKNDPRILDLLLIPNSTGDLVPLKKIATVENLNGSLTSIRHFDRKRAITVSADVDEKKITSIEATRLVRDFYETNIQPRFLDYTIAFGGESEETIESFRNFGKAIVFSIFLIFMILAAQFKSLIQPLVVMSAIPLGIIGVVFAFKIHGYPFSFLGMLGIVGLVGVVVNDSIVLVDFINKLRLEGKSRYESIIQAGRLRFRAVILTSTTTVLGLAPVVYGIGGSDPFVKPMALAISWGLMFATALTLLVIPCFYSLWDDVSEFAHKHKPHVRRRIEQ